MKIKMGHHHHHHRQKTQLTGQKLSLAILLNSGITLAQAVVGFGIGSLSLLSDALHNFSDVVSLLVSYFADKLTKREYTAQQTFGYKRAEIIAALINTSSLLGIAVMLCREAFLRLNEPLPLDSKWVVILAAAGMLVNGICVMLLKEEARDSMNIQAAYLHLFSDMLISITVMVSGLAIYFFEWYWLDSLLAVAIAIYLVITSWSLLIRSLKVLMQFSPSHISLAEIESAILKFSAIGNLHHVHIWQLDDKEVHFEAHLDFKSDLKLSEATQVIKQIEQMLHERFKIHHVVIQPEIGSNDPKQLIVDACHHQ